MLGVKDGGYRLGAVFSFQNHARHVVGLFEHLHDLCHHADAVQIDQLGVVDNRVLLRGEKNQLILAHCLVDGGYALLSADVKMNDRLWKHDHTAQRQHRKRQCVVFVTFHSISFHHFYINTIL